MKNGFSIVLDIIKRYGMRSVESVGLVVSDAKKLFLHLRKNKVNVEYNTDTPLYNFIFIPEKYFSVDYLVNYFEKNKNLEY